MIVIKISKVKDKYKLFFDSHDPVIIFEDTYINFNLKLKMEVNHELLEKLLSDDKKEKAFNQTFKYALKYKTEEEIKKYIKKYELSLADEHILIKRLFDLNLINDQNIVEQYLNKKESKKKLMHQLSLRGISQTLIDEYFKDFNETDNMLQVYQKNLKRFSKYPDADVRMIRYLLSKGFDYHQIKKMVGIKSIEFD